MYEKLKPLREDEPEITDEQYLKAGLRPDHHAILAINTKRLRAIVDARIEKL